MLSTRGQPDGGVNLRRLTMGDPAVVAFLGESLMTDALLANPRVAYVYG